MNVEQNHTYTFEEILSEYGMLTYRTQGVSMRPMLHAMRDIVSIRRKGAERCSLYDVVLYKRGPKYILHRIIEVRDNDYVILGDNCFTKEYGITDADILGVLDSFVRKGRTYTMDDRRYRRYVRWLIRFQPIRVALAKARFQFRQMLKRIGPVRRAYYYLRGKME